MITVGSFRHLFSSTKANRSILAKSFKAQQLFSHIIQVQVVNKWEQLLEQICTKCHFPLTPYSPLQLVCSLFVCSCVPLFVCSHSHYLLIGHCNTSPRHRQFAGGIFCTHPTTSIGSICSAFYFTFNFLMSDSHFQVFNVFAIAHSTIVEVLTQFGLVWMSNQPSFRGVAAQGGRVVMLQYCSRYHLPPQITCKYMSPFVHFYLHKNAIPRDSAC